MQTTILGLAVALILALVAALVGPFVVDWTRYRTEIEAQASRIVGAPVEVLGPIDVRLLPTPSLALHSVAISAGKAEFSARSLRFELALGSLMRGEWRVSELTLGEPRFRFGVDRGGALLPLPIAAKFDADRLTFERITILDGRVMLTDAENDRSVVLEKLSFQGDLRSLAGPLRGDGRFTAEGGAYRFRLSTGRGSPQGIKLRLGLDAPGWPLIVETDGVVSLDGEHPHYDGTLALSGPASAVLADGRAVARDPWRATARVRADPQHAAIEDLELHYGPEDRLLRLSGRADLAFTPDPRFAVTLAGHQMLLDRLVDGSDAAGGSPLQALPAMLGALLRSGRPPIPGKLDLTLDQVTFAGSSLQSIRALAEAGDEGWTVTALDFRAPGATQVHLGGRLQTGESGLAYVGSVGLRSGEPGALLSFIEGKTDLTRPPIGPLVLSGEAAIKDREVRLDRLHIEIDGKPIEGHIAYAPATDGGSSRLDATLAAAEVDLDSATAIAKSAFAGASLEWPRTMALALRVSRLTYSGVNAGRVDARLRLDPNGLAIERFSIGDLRGANVNATGLIDIGSSSPHGALSVALTAARTEGLAALVSRFAPQAAEEINRYATQLGSADLHGRLEIAPAKPQGADRSKDGAADSQAKLTIGGKLGAVRINLNASAHGKRDALAAATVKAEGSIEADDGRLLAALTGVDRLVAIEARPALLTLAANGALDGALACDLRLAAGGLSAAGTGKLRLRSGEWSGNGDVAVTATDARPLLNAGAEAALPVTLDGQLAFAGPALTVETLKGRIGDSNFTGRLAMNLSVPIRVDGRIDATDVDMESVIATAVTASRRSALGQAAVRALPEREPESALGSPTSGQTVIWSTEPFGTPLFANLRGRIAFVMDRAGLLPGLSARQVRGSARFDGSSVTLENLSGTVADGPFTADATIQVVPAGLSMQASVSVANADLAQIDFGGDKPPASGRINVSADLRGAGRSPATLIGALHGSGQLNLAKVQISGLDPNAIDAAISAAERGLPLERLATFLGPALDAAKLSIPAAKTTIDVVDGQVRLAPIITRPGETEVVLSATFNLATDMLDAQVTLAGKPRKELQDRRPEVALVLRGPLSAPERSIEAGALLSYVTLQAVEREAERVRAAEREARRRDAIAAARERAERERAAKLRLEELKRAEEQRRVEEQRRAEEERRLREVAPEQSSGLQQNATAPAGNGGRAMPDQAPALPPPIEIKPQPITGPVPAPRARPLPREPAPERARVPQQGPVQQLGPAQQWAPPRRSFWDELFGGRR
ncbi:MAG: AsmA family protein [Xanthobacteraceae bacterium]